MKKILLFTVATLMLCACQKAQEEPQAEHQTETQTENQQVTMNGVVTAPIAFNGTFTEVCNAMMYVKNSGTTNAPTRLQADKTYPAYTWTPQDGTWPIDLTVEYGQSGVIATDGLMHKGKMTIHATGFFETPNTIMTPDFTDFYVYGNILNGKQTIANTGLNAKGNLVFKVTTEDGRLGSGRTYKYSEETFRELVKGLEGTGALSPDITTHTYSITGWMKAESLIDTLPGCTFTISDVAPMVIAAGDLYPREGYLNVELTKPLIYNMNNVNIEATDFGVEFTGKQSGNQYGAIAYMTFKVGPIEQDMKVAFLLDDEGVVAGSMQILSER